MGLLKITKKMQIVHKKFEPHAISGEEDEKGRQGGGRRPEGEKKSKRKASMNNTPESTERTRGSGVVLGSKNLSVTASTKRMRRKSKP